MSHAHGVHGAAGTRQSCAALSQQLASATTAHGANSLTERLNNASGPEKDCSGSDRFIHSGLSVSEYVRQQRQEALRKRAACEMSQRLPCLDSYVACIRQDPMLMSQQFDAVVLATQRRCEEWHFVRECLRREYEDPWLLHYDIPFAWETDAAYQQRLLTL